MNIFAAIDLETTGLVPAWNEVLEVAIVPLNADFTIANGIPEFSCRIRAEHPERIDPKAIAVNKLDPTEGMTLKEAQSKLAEWVLENEITTIIPLAHNLAFDMDFIKVSFPMFSRLFSHHGRDSMRLAISLNDALRMRDGEVRFTSVSLQSLKLALDIEGDVRHNALEDAQDTARVYRKLMRLLRAA